MSTDHEPLIENIHRVLQLILYAQRGVTLEADAVLAGHGFGRAHFRILYILAQMPGTHLKSLVDGLGVSHQAVSLLLRELIEEGLVSQVEDETDRRKRLLFLTEAGEALERVVYDKQAEVIRRALTVVGPAGERTLVRGLDAMVAEGDRSIVQALQDAARLRNAGPVSEGTGPRG